MRACIVAFVVALVLASAPSQAAAKKRVVVFGFSGPGGATFYGQVRQLLAGRATLLSGATYARAQRKLGIRRTSPANVRRIAARISADGMVGGIVQRLPGRRYRLRVIVRAGKTGQVVAAFNVTTRGRTLRGSALRETAANLRVALRRLPPLVKEENGDGDAMATRRKRPRKRKRVVARGDDDDDNGGEVKRKPKVERKKPTDDGDSTPSVKLTDAETADLLVRGRGLVVAGGLSVTSRTLAFTFTPGIANAPRGYKGNPVAGAYFRADLFPLGMDLKSKGASRNVGITFSVDKVIKINSRLKYNDPMTMQEVETDLPTEQLRWAVGAVYRHNFGSKPTDASVLLSARYNRFTFDIDKSAAPAGVTVDIPNVDYTYYDAGLAIRYPLSAKLAVLLEGRFMLMSSTGEIQEMTQFGGADVTGFDFDGGFEYRVNPRVQFRAGVRYTRFGFAFDGTGALATDVGGALDEYLGGYATLQYLF